MVDVDLETKWAEAMTSFQEHALWEIIDSNAAPKPAIRVPPNGLSHLILRGNLGKGEWNTVKGEAPAVKLMQFLKTEDGIDHLDMAFGRWQRCLVQVSVSTHFMLLALSIFR